MISSLFNPSVLFIAFNTYFLVIATIIGVGILSLPTTLSNCGFWPLVVESIPVVIMQCVIVLFMVELMQKAICINMSDISKQTNRKSFPYEIVGDRRHLEANGTDDATVGLLDEEEEEDGESIMEGTDVMQQEQQSVSSEEPSAATASRRAATGGNQETSATAPGLRRMQPRGSNNNNTATLPGCDLHSLASIYLPTPLQIIFETLVCANFVFLLAAYALAGSRAYSDFIDQSWYVYFILPFVAFFSCVVIFGFSVIQYLISFLTVMKGSLLLLVIVVVGIFSTELTQNYTNNFQYIARPLLITTASLGNSFATISLLFGRMKLTKVNVHVFTMSAIAAILTCWVLNLIWALIVLRVVPQNASEGPSLLSTYQNGEISTQPVTEIVLKHFPRYSFILSAINGFIILSISVSFITMGSAMLEMVRGYAKTKEKSALLFFALIIVSWVIAQTSSKDFEMLLESLTSFCINLTSGVFVGGMLIASLRFKNVQVPVSLGNNVLKTLCALLVCLCFMLLCVFDVVYTPLRYILKENLPF